MSATCTHLGCMTRFMTAESTIFCPCHGSRFNLDGQVTGGPAPEPLRRYHLSLDGGQLTIDAARPVAADFVLRA